MAMILPIQWPQSSGSWRIVTRVPLTV